MSAQAERSLWVLLVADPGTGAATRPAGVLGLDGDDHHASWVPLEPGAGAWMDRLNASTPIPLAGRVAFWAEHANGRTLDLAPIDETGAHVRLHDAVEAALDEVLAAEAGR